MILLQKYYKIDFRVEGKGGRKLYKGKLCRAIAWTMLGVAVWNTTLPVGMLATNTVAAATNDLMLKNISIEGSEKKVQGTRITLTAQCQGGAGEYSYSYRVLLPSGKVETIAEETVKKYYDKDFSKAIGKTHNTLFQAFANDSRMIAYLLCRHNKPFWALGWVCKSSTTYDKVHDENQRKTYKTLSISNIYVLIDCILQIYKQQVNGLSLDKILNNDNEEKKYEVAIRTTRDLVKFCSTIELRDKDYSAVFDDKSGKDIPETLNDTLIQFLRCLIKKLTVYCQETNQDLFDRLELENIDDENWEVHVSYYYKMEKWCNKHEAYKIESEFQKSAGKLYDMYSNYLQKLEN